MGCPKHAYPGTFNAGRRRKKDGLKGDFYIFDDKKADHLHARRDILLGYNRWTVFLFLQPLLGLLLHDGR